MVESTSTSWHHVALGSMIATGVWLPQSLIKSRVRYLYYLYALFFQIVMAGGIILIQIMHLCTIASDIGGMANVLQLMLTQVAQVPKMANYWCRQGRIRHLIEVLESPEFNREEPEKRAILESAANWTHQVGRFMAICTLFTGVWLCTFPLLGTSKALPVDYPHLTSGTPMFAAMYVYEWVAVVGNAMGDVGEDVFVGGLMMLSSAQLDVLSYEIGQIGENAAANGEDDGNDENYEKAVACVKYHQKIISFVNEIDEIFGFQVFCQFLASSIIICMTAFQIALTTGLTEILMKVFYLVCILTELLLFCYTGNVLLNKSQVVAEAAYCSAWVNTSVRTKKTLLLIIMRAQRPLSVTAGKIFDLSLPTYAAILKSSYTYFAVLKSSTSKDN